MEACVAGVEVRRSWSEREMVRSFGGGVIPGTPDGMFESWAGDLTCVQVVRVPLVCHMSAEAMRESLEQTLLAKVVKSQQWLRVSRIVPNDFVIFGWLPFAVPEHVTEEAQALMRRVRELDARFSLQLHTPADATILFPAMFACNYERLVEQRGHSFSESDVSTYSGSEEDSEEEEEVCEWDITWAWDEDWGVVVEELGGEDGSGDSDGQGEEEQELYGTSAWDEDFCAQSEGVESEWNIVWDDMG